MSDLIRREDALALRDKLADIIGALPMSSIYSALSEYRNAIRALPAVLPVTVRLVFANADATPKTTVLDVSAASVPDIMAWYGAYCSGDRYTVTVDGRNVPMDQNGEPAHVNETPKSEHDGADVLTPALVKPLVWQDFDGFGAKASAYYQANYLIQKWKSRNEFEVAMSFPGYQTGYDGPRWHATLDAAKAAAQADYAARILGAIDAVTMQAQIDAAREAALLEAAEYHEVMAADEDALSTKYRGGSNPWFAHVQAAKQHRDHAAAILALSRKGDQP